MKNVGYIVVIIIAVVAVLGIIGCSSTDVYPNTSAAALSVSGEGKVYATPDLGTLSIGVEAQAETVDQARTQAADAIDKVINSLKTNSIDEKDIQTSQYSIYPVTKWDSDTEEYVTVGFQATNTLTVKIRNLEEAGTIIDDAAAAGGDLTRIQGISFSVEDPKPYQEQARQAAFEDAMAKAETMAQLAGVELGQPISISESSGYIPPIYYAAGEKAMDQAASTPIDPGEQEITITVQISYGID